MSVALEGERQRGRTQQIEREEFSSNSGRVGKRQVNGLTFLRQFQYCFNPCFGGFVGHKTRICRMVAHQTQQLLNRLIERDFAQPPFHLRPLLALCFGQRRGIGIGILVDGCNQADVIICVVDKLGKLLNKIKLLLRLVANGIFQEFTKLIDHQHQQGQTVGICLS